MLQMTQEEARVRLRFFKKWTDKLARSNYFFHIILPKGMIIPLVVVVYIIVQTLVTLSESIPRLIRLSYETNS